MNELNFWKALKERYLFLNDHRTGAFYHFSETKICFLKNLVWLTWWCEISKTLN